MLSAAALAGFRSHVKNTVVYAKYKIGSPYYRSEITDITISCDGKVKIEFILNPSESGEVKVTEVQLYSTSADNVLFNLFQLLLVLIHAFFQLCNAFIELLLNFYALLMP